ncbi:MAG: hypothetical protein ACSW8J_02885 [bacterium]
MLYNKKDLKPQIELIIGALEEEYERTMHSQRIERIERMRQLANAINQLHRTIEIIEELPN